MVDWSTKPSELPDDSGDELLLAAGGRNARIQLLNVSKAQHHKTLTGHMDDIYDLKFHPQLRNLLLSASKDCSIRLWNVSVPCQLAIYAGVDGHFGGVNCIDWHASGELFASGGMDYCVKIWKITEEVAGQIEKSQKWTAETKQFPLYVCLAVFSSNKVSASIIS